MVTTNLRSHSHSPNQFFFCFFDVEPENTSWHYKWKKVQKKKQHVVKQTITVQQKIETENEVVILNIQLWHA